MIYGKKIYLESIDVNELEQLREWRNSTELRKYFREHREISRHMQNEWYNNRVCDTTKEINFGIHDIESGALIGHCGLYYINWISRYAEFGIYIGDNNFRRRGFGSDALRTLLAYGFKELNLNKIWAEVYSNNKALDMYLHIGFKVDGILRQNQFKEGKYLDSTVISMLQSEHKTNEENTNSITHIS